MAIRFISVTVSPQSVLVGQTVTIEAKISEGSWQTIKENFTSWDDVKNSFASWDDVKNY